MSWWMTQETQSLVPITSNYSSALNQLIIDELVNQYPFLTTGSIGTSVMGRNIPYLKIGTGDIQVFYNASFHANESITTPLLLKFAEEYAKEYAKTYQESNLTGMSYRPSGIPWFWSKSGGKSRAFLPKSKAGLVQAQQQEETEGKLYGVDASWLFQTFQLYLVPMVNPDGVDLVNGELNSSVYYEQARTIADNYPQIPFPEGWKANIDGIDLNLQFPAGWETAKAVKYAQGYQSPAPRDFVGEAPLTAPESRAVYEFTLSHDFQLILAYHTQGEVIYWRYLDYMPEYSYEIARFFQEVSGYALEETPQESGNAGYKDWFILNYNRPGYTIEVGSGINPLPITQFPQIYEDNKQILLGGMTELYWQKRYESDRISQTVRT